MFLQGWLFEIILTFFLVMVAGGLVLVIRALFDQDFGSLLIHAKVVTLRAAATAVCAPFVFRALSWFDQVSSKGTADARKVFRS